MNLWKLPRRALLVLPLALAAGCGRRTGGAEAPNGEAPDFAVDVIAQRIPFPWSLAFLPNGDALITQLHGGVRLLRANGRLEAQPLAGGPEGALYDGESGLRDIVLDPQFAENGLVYIAFSEGNIEANHLALYRARFDGEALVDGRVLFRARPDKRGAAHPSGRIAFLPDGTLLLAVGDGYDYRDQAQNLGSHLGKVLRLTREGAAPADNPLIARAGALPEIFTYGHRNTLGLTVDPRDGTIWQHENGPRGGDELNILRAGRNYGWPLASHGIDYDGTIITPNQEMEGGENPIAIFTPSIAPSGIALYLGDAFPAWRGDFFIGSLAFRHLRRVRIRDNIAVLEEVLLHEREARIRDVRVGPDGFLYLLTDDEAGEVWRLRPR